MRFASRSGSHFPPPGSALALAAAMLLLGGVGCKATPAVDDAAVATAVQGRIAGDSALNGEPIQSSVRGGVATLSGSVSSEAARALAGNDAAAIPGVRTVLNNLAVASMAANAAPAALPSPTVTAVAPAPRPVAPLSTRTRERTVPERRSPQPAPMAQSAPVERAAPPPVVAQGPAAPVAPPPPAFRDVDLPAGTELPVRITQTLDSATTQEGQSFSGTLASDVFFEGGIALQHGTAVAGRVAQVQEAGHFKGNSLLAVELTSVNRRPVSTEQYSKAGNGRGKNTAEKVGGGAAVGAILGGIFGGGKGAAIGAAAGGGAGAGTNAITRGQQVQIPSESLIRFRLTGPLRVRVSNNPGDSSPTAPSNDTGSGRRPLS